MQQRKSTELEPNQKPKPILSRRHVGRQCESFREISSGVATLVVDRKDFERNHILLEQDNFCDVPKKYAVMTSLVNAPER